MRIKTLAAFLLFAIGSAFSQSNDPVIMTINGKPIYKSEFEYSYNKNNSGNVIDKKSVEEYLPMFINYKLKVEDALSRKMDTLASFKNEFLMYRDQQIKPNIINDEDISKYAHQMYNTSKEKVGEEGWFLPAHIFIHLSQKAGEEEIKKAKERIDSIYNEIVNYKGDARDAFVCLAKECSEDKRTAVQGGTLGWIYKGQLMKELDNQMLSLNEGEISKPFSSPSGYHIMLLMKKRPFETFEEAKNRIYNFIELKNLKDDIADQKVDSIVKASNGTYTKEQLMDKYCSEMIEKDSEFKNLIKEYHDGLLLFEVSNKEVWGKSASDKDALNKFFKKNKKRYAWDEPRFKGIAYHSREEADIEAVKNTIKKLPFDEWANVLRKTFNNDSILRIRVEKGIFKKGDNGIVDRFVFGEENAKIDTIKNYPFISTYGKILKKGPECMEDVKGQVTADYQDMLHDKWVARLRKEYSFSVNRDVLATIKENNK